MTAPAAHPYTSFVHLVQKPARYLGGEYGARTQGLGERRRARLPRVPRRLRHRDEPPRLQDPLQDPERRSAHARRALLRAVGRHGGASSARAGCRSSRSRARARSRTSTSSASRSSSSSRTRTSSRCSTSAASRSAPTERGEDDPLVIAGGPTATHPEPLAPFLDAVRDRRRRGAHDRGRAHSGRARRREGVPRARAPRRAREARRRVRAVALRDDASSPTPGFDVVDRALAPGLPLPGRAHARRRSRTASRSPTTARSAGPRRSSIACRSRSRAAAPRAAASARPG